MLSPGTDYALLVTAIVRIMAANGNSAEFRTILDSGQEIVLINIGNISVHR